MNRALARLIAAQASLHAAMAGARLAAPLCALGAGYSPAAVGVLVALFALTQVFLALPAGRFADRHGVRRPLALAVAMAAFGAALPVLLPSYAALCIAALCTGGATGVAIIATQRHVGRMVEGPTQLKQAFSWLALGPALSNFAGPFVAGLLIDHAGDAPADGAGFRWAFACMVAFALAGWAFGRTAPAGAGLPPRPLPQVDGAHTPSPTPRPRAWHLLQDPAFRRLLAVNWLFSFAWDLHSFLLPVLGHERGIAASAIGAILGAFAIAATAVRIVLPLLAHRIAEWATLLASLLTTAVLFALYPLLHTPWALGGVAVLLGAALGVVQPMVLSLLHQGAPDGRLGEALGLRLMALNASSVAMPLALGAAGAAFGIAPIFWCAAGLLVLGVPAVRRLRGAAGV